MFSDIFHRVPPTILYTYDQINTDLEYFEGWIDEQAHELHSDKMLSWDVFLKTDLTQASKGYIFVNKTICR